MFKKIVGVDQTMGNNFSSLPSLLLRQAYAEDKSVLYKLCLKFIKAEGLDFHRRIILFRHIVPILVVLVFLIFQILVYAFLVQEFFMQIPIFFTVFFLFLRVLLLLYYLNFSWRHPLLKWQFYWVVEYRRNIVACVGFQSDDVCSLIYNLYVEPSWRRQGIASLLIKRLIEEAETPIFLVCKPKLVNFYTRLGFATILWAELPEIMQQKLMLFKPDRALKGYPLAILFLMKAQD